MIQERLAAIQRELKAPKGQFNAFGKYKYRSCEDILEAVKPLLGDAVLTFSDNLVMLGDRYYVRATASLRMGEEVMEVTAWAREEADKKGMDAAQITGSVSSYARKYAANGLFLIDDTKDADTMDNTEKKGGAKSGGNTNDTARQIPVGLADAPPSDSGGGRESVKGKPDQVAPNPAPPQPETLPVGTELRTKVDGLIQEAGIDKVEFKKWLFGVKKISKKFGNPSLSTMSVKTAESMIAVWPQTMKAFNLWMDKKAA